MGIERIIDYGGDSREERRGGRPFAYDSRHLMGRVVGICNLDVFLDPASDWAATGPLLRRGKVCLVSIAGGVHPPLTTHLDTAFARVAHPGAQCGAEMLTDL